MESGQEKKGGAWGQHLHLHPALRPADANDGLHEVEMNYHPPIPTTKKAIQGFQGGGFFPLNEVLSIFRPNK